MKQPCAQGFMVAQAGAEAIDMTAVGPPAVVAAVLIDGKRTKRTKEERLHGWRFEDVMTEGQKYCWGGRCLATVFANNQRLSQ